jgi:hypothetical protein
MRKERGVMGADFQTLAQAEDYIHAKQNGGRSTIAWYIVDWHRGFLVVRKAQARHCFPGVFDDGQASVTHTESLSSCLVHA